MSLRPARTIALSVRIARKPGLARSMRLRRCARMLVADAKKALLFLVIFWSFLVKKARYFFRLASLIFASKKLRLFSISRLS